MAERSTPTPGWTALQRDEGAEFLQWIRDSQALQTGFKALSNALQELLKDRVRTKEDALALWTAVPAVTSRCNDPRTYAMAGAASAYAWIHLPDRYVRTWLALEVLVQRRLLPMGKEGVHALDVGTGPGPSAFATHDFYAAMMRYADTTGRERWRQPANLTCVETACRMNRFRHHLAEHLCAGGAPNAVLAMCNQLTRFEDIRPSRDRRALNTQLRDEYDQDCEPVSGEWEPVPRYTVEEASNITNTLHRYRLFTFSNVLTTRCTVERLRASLVEVLRDARPGSVLLIIGGKGHEYPAIYEMVAALARESGFSRNANDLTVSSARAEMKDMVHAEQVRFYHRLKCLGGNLADENREQKTVKLECQGEIPIQLGTSAVRAYRK